MKWNTTPGKHISRLPQAIWPAAIFLRNIYLIHIRRFLVNYFYQPQPWEKDIYRTLAASVSYVHAAAVPGDLAEFGTMSGRTARALANALRAQPIDLAASGPRRLLLFDSFEGLPEATNQVDRECIHVADGTWSPGTCKELTAQELSTMVGRILPPRQVLVFEGWFSETVAKLPSDTQLALVHIDCDLYQSTLDVLEGLFARKLVAAGATLLFDDWLCNRASPDHGEQKAWHEVTRKYDIRYTDAGPYGAFSWRFIVHSYNGVVI